ncbi:MAG: DUF5960 family protein [Furfurilactobacillus sp.]|uniref:DUF5960 family protein n=2 Tax=Furfurilactobacillus TaxID=2767882 RepID=A0A6N9I1L8_9LACO|nr:MULTISPECIES: DUF5960 family protein [Furfurilactobacillus]MCF6160613.1 DUF5960 family protein [Furfurilactobacillus milii]MCF6162845.1 DUF5960 family protein [Furfurilactobacillus milii]MCF6164864.1 DUF5960 family protein [Furfurilactobacillus rossiae]MCF6420235.1 DUF5960 family protein [Furfurilactobacillus milii]MCH4010504.1 DUF5960 family protein [Furfurilactobacillus sp.]
MITNAETFLTELKNILRGTYTDDQYLIEAVVNRLQMSTTTHYEVSKWRANDHRDHEFTFKQNEDQTYTYLTTR